MQARIYRPSKSAMSSGLGKSKEWVLEFAPEKPREIDPLMGWTATRDTRTQVKLHFDSEEAALEYAREHGIDAVVVEPHDRKPNIRPGGYGDNFAANRRVVWTH